MSSQLRDYKTEKVAELIAEIHSVPITKILVVGCGSGLEAAILAQRLGAEVTGIDLHTDFNPEALKHASLEKGDATALAFDDATFDFVYSYHTLEHIDKPLLSLQEIDRVLKKGGGYWMGTPNRHRALGYIGSKHATLAKKFKYNFVDWKARLKGKFRNEYGAHAGFSAGELNGMLGAVFGEVKEVSDQYYLKIYKAQGPLLALLSKTKLSRVAYPSVYFMGTSSKSA